MLIIGGGIAGCVLAFELSRRGAGVTLLERGRVGAEGASAVGAALLNPYRGRSARPGPLDLDGLAAFWRLASALEEEGLDPGARRSGVLRMPSNERQARTWRRDSGLVELEAAPPPYRAPSRVFLAPDAGWVEPAMLLRAMRAAAAPRGAEFVENCPVERVDPEAGGWVARTSRGDVHAERVVLCLGAGTLDGPELPVLERIAGDQVTLASAVELPRPIAGPVYLASNGGRVLVGGNHRPAGTDDPRAPELLRASASRLVPALDGASIERTWTGVRAKRPDNRPLLRELAPGLWYLGAFGGRGFLTAPLLAARLADDLTA